MDKELISGNLLDEKNQGQQKIVIYQMMTRLFGNKITANKPYGTMVQNGIGKFADINDLALSSLSDLGITHIWYTGVIEHALLTDNRKYGISLDDADVVKGRAGSPYAIKDYYDVNPDLALAVEFRMKEFEALIKRTHDHRLKVILDFVPNHVARKYHSDSKPNGIKDLGVDDDNSVIFAHNNNFYYLPGEPFKVPVGYDPLGKTLTYPTEDNSFHEYPAKVSGNNVFKAQPDINDWFETVKLNYGIDYSDHDKKHFEPIPDTWQKMRDILIFWASKDIDGFRCDMAEMIPVEFWEWVIPQVKEVRKDILFIAEIYNPAQYENYLIKGKFDYLYDKVQLYDTLKHIIQGKGITHSISAVWKSLTGINHCMLRFLENHDEQRVASPFFAGDPYKALPAMVVSGFLYNGPVMIYFGQEVGELGAGIAGFSSEDGRTTIYDYWGVPAHQRWMNNGVFDGGKLSAREDQLRKYYFRILNISKSHPAISKGLFFDLYQFNLQINLEKSQQIYYFLRFTETEKLLVVVNFGDREKQKIIITIPNSIIDHKILNPDNEITAKDLLNLQIHTTIKSNKENGTVPLELNPLACHVFEF